MFCEQYELANITLIFEVQQKNTFSFLDIKICRELFYNENVYFKYIFKYDGYQDNFIDFCIKRFFDELYETLSQKKPTIV